MDFFIDLIKKYWQYIIISILVLLILSFITIRNFRDKAKPSVKQENIIAQEDVKTEEKESELIYVDVKGEVKKPGVYELLNSAIINDAIKSAGGFTKKAYTNNINLSKKVEDELVIYVYSKNEMTKKKKATTSKKQTSVCYQESYDITGCESLKESIITSNIETATVSGENIKTEASTDTSVENSKNETTISSQDQSSDIALNNKISINNATIDELMTLNGIGESKAKNIIEYREQNGLFKNIEEIMNVSGIGNAAFEKIKDSITI